MKPRGYDDGPKTVELPAFVPPRKKMRSYFRARPKRDANHAEIVAALEAHGRRVIDLSGVGGGVPDILVACGSGMWLMEIKGAKGKLSPVQVAFRQHWPRKVYVVRDAIEALHVTGIQLSQPSLPKTAA